MRDTSLRADAAESYERAFALVAKGRGGSSRGKRAGKRDGKGRARDEQRRAARQAAESARRELKRLNRGDT
jgi:hypothetical protein